MKITEINAQTGEVTTRDMTAEEIAAMEEMENIPEPVPQSITSRQLRLQWVYSGYTLDMIETAIEQLPEPDKSIARINWEYAGTFDRDNAMLADMAVALGISSEQLDEFYRQAARL